MPGPCFRREQVINFSDRELINVSDRERNRESCVDSRFDIDFNASVEVDVVEDRGDEK